MKRTQNSLMGVATSFSWGSYEWFAAELEQLAAFETGPRKLR